LYGKRLTKRVLKWTLDFQIKRYIIRNSRLNQRERSQKIDQRFEKIERVLESIPPEVLKNALASINPLLVATTPLESSDAILSEKNGKRAAPAAQSPSPGAESTPVASPSPMTVTVSGNSSTLLSSQAARRESIGSSKAAKSAVERQRPATTMVQVNLMG